MRKGLSLSPNASCSRVPACRKIPRESEATLGMKRVNIGVESTVGVLAPLSDRMREALAASASLDCSVEAGMGKSTHTGGDEAARDATALYGRGEEGACGPPGPW